MVGHAGRAGDRSATGTPSAEAKKAGLNLSAVTQEAVRRALAERSTDAWLATLVDTASTQRLPHDRALDAIDAAREATTHRG